MKKFNFILKKRIYLAVASVLYLVLAEYGVVAMTEADWNKYVEIVAFVLVTVGIMIEPKKVEQEMIKEENIGA